MFTLAFALLALPAPPQPVAPAFVENLGQTDSQARFVGRTPGSAVFATADGFRLALLQARGDAARGVNLFVRFADATAVPVGSEPTGALFHDLRGDDPSRWVRDARGFAAVAYRGLRPGVDALLRCGAGALTLDFALAPGVDASAVPRLEIDGAEGLSVDADGALRIATAIGALRWAAPRTTAIDAGGTVAALSSRWIVETDRTVRLAVDGGVRAQRVVIDPDLEFSTLLGGLFVGSGSTEFASDVLVEPSGSSIVLGWTTAVDFPLTPGAFDLQLNGARDVFVTRFSPDGSAVVASTLLGGLGYDEPSRLARGADGSIYLTGNTDSPNYPATLGAFDQTQNGFYDEAFVTRLTPALDGLVYSTYLGGENNDLGWGIAVDAAGNAYVAGQTNSTAFPTTLGAYDSANAGHFDAFVTKIAANGSALLYSTYLGASGVYDAARGIALGAGGEAVVVGSGSEGFPFTHESFDPVKGAGMDAFVVRLNAAGTGLIAGTFLDGTGASGDGIGVAVGADDSVAVLGSTTSGFPATPGALDTMPSPGLIDMFVARLDGSLTTLEFGTYLDSNDYDTPAAIAVDPSGAIVVCGQSANQTFTFPVTPGALATTGWAYAARLRADGSSLTYGTYLPGAYVTGIAVDPAAGTYLTGIASNGFPTTPGAFDTSLDIGGDAFLMKFDLCPGEIEAHGTGCPGAGGITPSLAVTGCASPGFALEVALTDALGHAPGLLLFGLGSGSLALHPNCALSIGPLLPALSIPVTILGTGSGGGSIEFAATIPEIATPVEFHMQAVVADPLAAGGVSASNAVRIRIDA